MIDDFGAVIASALLCLVFGLFVGMACGYRSGHLCGREEYGIDACHKAGHEAICLNGECHCTDEVKP